MPDNVEVTVLRKDVACLKAQVERQEKVLRWLNCKGGLGYEAHGRIARVLRGEDGWVKGEGVWWR